MADINQIPVTVVQPGEGEYVALPGFGAVFKLSSKANGGEVSIVEHPFEVGVLTAAHRHTREDEHSIELADKFGLTYGAPAWMDDIRQRYGLSPPSH
jgi:hypothetical protein